MLSRLNLPHGRFVLIVSAMLLWSCSDAPVAGPNSTQNIFLITVDGLRWNELFGGADSLLLFSGRGGVKNPAAMAEHYWRSTPTARREALMPFFWQELAPRGVVYGNRHLGSYAQVANKYRVSAPGYAEIFTGFPQDDVIDNSRKQVTHATIFEFVRAEWRLSRSQVAAFTSWDLFPYLVSKDPGAIYINAGFAGVEGDKLTREQLLMNRLQETLPKQWDDVRYDALTFYQGLEFIKQHQPRLVYFSFGETDDWAHNGRYDQVLQAATRIDGFIEELWRWAQSHRNYRDKTTFIIASDHGRGSSGSDEWKSHGATIEEADFTWIAVIGPDTPDRGELSNTGTVRQQSIAATIAGLLGLDYSKAAPQAAPALPLAVSADH
ncbi:MAG: alkaline phosphatase family protein [Candidatus Marinimicrobia bacterium]|nr:alkaline phosphatase family protein [Candidatus Neomarinimicrobiota bacterium]